MALLACGLAGASPVSAAVTPARAPVAEKAFRHPALHIPARLEPSGGVPGKTWITFRDPRAGRLASFILSEPLVPGSGNSLRRPAGVPPADGDAAAARAWGALRGFLVDNRRHIDVDLAELGAPNVAVLERGALVQISVPRVVGGVPVRDAALTAVVRHGNLVLLGLDRWGDVTAPGPPAVGEGDAGRRIAGHFAPHAVEAIHGARLEYVPMASGNRDDYRLAWTVRLAIAGDLGSWEGLVDAASGEVLALTDRNEYSRTVVGGVYPVSNDQRPPDGIEQPGWPMPFADLGAAAANAHGLVSCAVAGSQTTTLTGTFVRATDQCGPIAGTSAGDIDLGASTGTDCVVPAGQSGGDTHAARTAYYGLNRLKEQARGYLPGNAWLNAPLPVSTNINQACNAFWDGTGVGFFRDGGGPCRNTGEIAGIVGHEFGHGLDDNGVDPTVSRPAGGIADVHAFLLLQEPCVGRGFWKNQVCTGYGTPCDPPVATGCTGARHMDYMGYVCDRPHTVTTITQGFTAAECNGVARPACPGAGTTAPCGRGDHCEGIVVAETAFDLARRDLPAAGFDANTAHEITTRLFTLGSGPVAAWYTCSVGGGCAASGGYLQLLAADDDNGNLSDGTPHMTAIRAAFERHEIHCAVPAAVDSGCSGGPAGPPALAATAGVEQVALGWSAVPGAAAYAVYRTDGVSGCDFGKVKVAEVGGTSFADTGMLAGRAYSYVVLPLGSNPSCLGRASNCAPATPSPAPPCAAASVAPEGLAVDAAGNGVYEPNETVAVAPAWRNTGTQALALTGALTDHLGPAGATYIIPDATADYGTIAGGDAASCTATSNCYSVANTTAARPATHWDTTVVETVAPTATAKTWTLHVGGSFTDVPGGPFFRFIETLLHRGVTGGCTATTYCPGSSTTREQMAVFVLISKEGAAYNPPPCVAGAEQFADVPASSPFCKWIEELSDRGVVAGCGGGNYCPGNPVTREQMAVFVLRTLDPALSPPACVPPNIYADVPETSPFCRWIEELTNRSVVTGCGGGHYCPAASVTREQMGVFLAVTFGLALYGL